MDSIQYSARLIRGLRSFSRIRSPTTHHNGIGLAICQRRRIETGSRHGSHQKGFVVEDILRREPVMTADVESDPDRKSLVRVSRTENHTVDEGDLLHSDEAQLPDKRTEVSNRPGQIGQNMVRVTRVKVATRIRKIESNVGNYEMIRTGTWRTFDPFFLRDSCTCKVCVDPSTKQKTFQTTDIPETIRAKSATILEDGNICITWQNDIPGIDPAHKTILSADFLKIHANRLAILDDRYETTKPVLWDKERIESRLEYVNYDEYLNTTAGLFTALRQLQFYGLLLIREVPESEESVKKIAERIGNLRDSFYGRTWDVKSVPQAKNVAYTSQYLGLHMDLLYMANPPGFQFLHCLKNTCEGGASLFSDSFKAAEKLGKLHFNILAKTKISYHYRNAGEHYYYRHPVLERRDHSLAGLAHVNYSPPFQANLQVNNHGDVSDPEKELRPFIQALKKFATNIESEKNLFEYRLQAGECVVFNNRRILHGRRQFDTSSGERWLKGAYIDTDVFMSRWRVLREKWVNKQFRVNNEDSKFVSSKSFGLPDGERGSNDQQMESLQEETAGEK